MTDHGHVQRQTLVLDGMARIFREALSCTTEEQLGEVCLTVAEELTCSEDGFIGVMDRTTRDSHYVAFDAPGPQRPGGHTYKHLAGSICATAAQGLSDSVLAAGRSFFTNDPSSPTNPFAFACGNLALNALLAVPLMQAGQMVGLIGLANRPGGYYAADLEAVESLTPAIVQALVSKRAEAELRQNSERYRWLVEQAVDGIFVSDARGRYLDVNSAGCQMLGYTREEICARSIADLVAPEEVSRIVAEIDRAAGGAVIRSEWRFRRKDGSFFYGEVVSRQLPDGRLQAFLRDITDRKQSEKALRESEALSRRQASSLQTLLDSTPAIIWIAHDRECRSITGNRAAYQFSRVSPGQDLSKTGPAAERLSHYRLFHGGRELSPQEMPIQRVAASGIELRDYEIEFVFDDGVHRTLMGNVVPLLDAAGQLAGALAAFVDITDRKHTEEALRQSREDLARAQAVGRLGSWRLDVQRNVLSWSDENYRIFGVPAGSPQTYETFLELVHPDDRDYVDQQWRAGLDGEMYDVEHRIVTNGQVKWVREKAYLEFDANHVLLGGFGITQDITERKQVEEELATAKEAADQANRAKDHFLAVLSHELRTPLTPVMMGISMLQNRHDLAPAVHDTLEMIRRNVEMEAQLIDDLLDVTRIARGKIDLHRSRVDLSTIIDRAIEVCGPDMEARGLRLLMDLGQDGPYYVDADESRLQQVFWNLLKNAIKFTPHGGSVYIRCCHDGKNRVAIAFTDTGIGIEPEALSRVFNAFEQAEISISRQFGGVGLGLAISKALVEMHNGTIDATSEGRNRGSTFRVCLPLLADEVVSKPPATPASTPRACPLRILLVEDHGVTVKMMKSLLAEEGHSVETAGDVATALELAGEQKFDLLLSDLGLPDGSGYDLMRELRRRGHAFPGIALSGYGQEDDVRRSREAGFAVHLTKPTSREAILEAVASLQITAS